MPSVILKENILKEVSLSGLDSSERNTHRSHRKGGRIIIFFGFTNRYYRLYSVPEDLCSRDLLLTFFVGAMMLIIGGASSLGAEQL